jgi:hypothetical protein
MYNYGHGNCIIIKITAKIKDFEGFQFRQFEFKKSGNLIHHSLYLFLYYIFVLESFT